MHLYIIKQQEHNQTQPGKQTQKEKIIRQIFNDSSALHF